jgi:Ca2+-binding RTX toxin-like protein
MSTILPSVGISLTPITVDVQDRLLAPYLVQSATYKDVNGVERNGASLLNLSLNVGGTLPAEGVVVNVTADKDLYRIFSGLSRPIFSPGAQILGPLLNPAGETIGFQVRLLTPNPVVTLRVNNNTLLPNELTRINFAVQPGDGYTVDNKAASAGTRVVNDLASVPVIAAPPVVTFTATNTTLTEFLGNSVTLNFSLSSPPPADGVIVKLSSDAAGSLSDFNVFQIKPTGGAYPVGVGSNGFFFKITSQNASITVPVFSDGEVEGVEDYRFTVQSGYGYTVNAASSSALITIKDTPTTTLPFVSLTGTPATLVEAAGTVSRHTFTLSVAPPADGFIVSVAAPNISEFDLSKIKVTGGSVAGLTADGFTLKMTDRRTLIELPVKNDGVAEGRETAVFTLKPAASYTINPAAGKAEFSILDVAATPTNETESNDTLEKANVLPLANNSTVSIKGAIDYSASNTYRAKPTDAGNTFVDPTEDVDMYKVTLKKGDKIKVDVDGNQDESKGLLLDSVLRVFDATGKELAFADSVPAPDEIYQSIWDAYLEFEAPTDGDYYIGVNIWESFKYDPKTPGSGSGYSDSTWGVGQYTLNVSLNDPTAFVPKATTISTANGKGPAISLETITGTYKSDFSNLDFGIINPYLVENVGSPGSSVLTLVLSATGEIPAGGVEVFVKSDTDLTKQFATNTSYGNNLAFKPFSKGGEFLDAVYDSNGKAVGFKFRLDRPNAVINFPVKSDDVAESAQAIKFSLQEASGYTLNSAAKDASVTVYDSVTQLPAITKTPEISLAISNTALVESQNSQTTLTFTLSEAPPAEGVLVWVNAGEDAIGEFDVFAAKIEGGVFPAADGFSTGFYFKVLKQTATITLPVFNSPDLAEGLEGYTFTLQPGPGYKVAQGKGSVDLTIAETASSKISVRYNSSTDAANYESGTLIESAGTISTHTFALSAKPPAGGITIFVKSDNLSDFDFTKAEITGAKVVGFTATGFNLNITDKQAVVKVPVRNDGKSEVKETATFTIEPGITYEVNPDGKSATFTIYDSPSNVPFVESEGNSLNTVNDVIKQAIDTKLGSDNTSFKIKAEIGNVPTFEGLLDKSEDVDLYKVELKAGDRIKIDIDSLPFTVTGQTVQQFVDSEIRLFDSTGKQVAISTDNAAPGESFTVTRDPYLSYYATTAGTYYIGVAGNSNRYYDPNVAGSGGGRVIPASGINIGKYDLAIDLEPFKKPEISLTATPVVIDEEKGSILTLNLSTAGTIPPEGLVVELKGNVANILAQFTSLQTRANADGSLRRFITPNTIVSGGIIGAVEPDLSSFKFTILKPTASIQLPVLNDLIEEADQSYSYSLTSGSAYTVNPTASTASFKVTDGVPGGVGPVVGFTASPTALYESEATAVKLTFNVTGTIPAEGVVVVLDSGTFASIAEFDVTASNPRTPENNFTTTGPVVTGGRIVGSNEIASALFFRITEKTATITVPVFQDGEAEGKETFTYRLLDGEKYQVDPKASSATITIEDTKPVLGKPIVSVTVTPDRISEADGTLATFTFKTTGTFPKEGLIIATNDLFDPQFDFNFEFEDPKFLNGIEFFDYIEPATGEPTVLWKLTKPEAFIKLKAFDDNIAEADVQSTVRLKPQDGYTINPSAASATVTISDGVPNVGGPTVSLAIDKATLTEGDTFTITLNAVGVIPAQGLQVHLDTETRAILGQFEIFDTNGNFLPKFTGLKGLPQANEDASGLSVVMTGNTATLTLKVFRDEEAEGTQKIDLKLLDGETYDAKSGASQVTLNISDPSKTPAILYGNNTDDVLSAGDGNNIIYAGEGNNTITTGSGNDLIYAGAGNDIINAGGGNNNIYAGEGNNTINSRGGKDLIFAGAGNDMISSGAGDDLIYAGEGKNTIDAGTGLDQVYSGSGADIFKLNKGDGFVTINGIQSIDKFSLGADLVASDLKLTLKDGDTIISTGNDQLAVVKWTQLNNVNLA